METFFIVSFICLVLIGIFKGTKAVVGKIGCLIIFFIWLISFIMFLQKDAKETEEANIRMDEAVEEIRKRKQRYKEYEWNLKQQRQRENDSINALKSNN